MGFCLASRVPREFFCSGRQIVSHKIKLESLVYFLQDMSACVYIYLYIYLTYLTVMALHGVSIERCISVERGWSLLTVTVSLYRMCLADQAADDAF